MATDASDPTRERVKATVLEMAKQALAMLETFAAAGIRVTRLSNAEMAIEPKKGYKFPAFEPYGERWVMAQLRFEPNPRPRLLYFAEKYLVSYFWLRFWTVSTAMRRDHIASHDAHSPSAEPCKKLARIGNSLPFSKACKN